MTNSGYGQATQPLGQYTTVCAEDESSLGFLAGCCVKLVHREGREALLSYQCAHKYLWILNTDLQGADQLKLQLVIVSTFCPTYSER